MVKKLICKVRGHKHQKEVKIENIKLLDEGWVEIKSKCKRCGEVETFKNFNPIMYAMIEMMPKQRTKLEVIDGGRA